MKTNPLVSPWWRIAVLLVGFCPVPVAAQFVLDNDRPDDTPRDAHQEGRLYLSADSVLGAVGYVVRDGWRYHHGDEAAWRQPGFDDGAWPIGSSHRVPEEEPWPGIGWFRVRLEVDSALVGIPLGLHVVQAGASETYLDGELVYQLGRVAADTREEQALWDQRYPRIVTLGAEQVLAVRYSNASTNVSQRLGVGAGFYFVIGDLARLTEARVTRERHMRSMQTFFTAVPLTFALLHLFLFLFYPRLRGNLYFALLTAALAANNYVDLQAVFAEGPAERTALIHLHGLASLLCGVFGLRLAYHFQGVRRQRHHEATAAGSPGRRFWVFVGAGLALWAWRVAVPSPTATTLLAAFYLVVLVEIFRVVVPVQRSVGRTGWAIGVGLILALASMIAQVLVVGGVLAPFTPVPVYYYGVLALLLTISLALSARFARTSRDLEARLAEVEALTQRTLEQERRAHEAELARRLLEADHGRKTHELEEARRLQLSMLPRALPVLDTLDIAVYTATASEVGGDYYDFHVGPDGTLTVAVGDATGHGTAAGLMVASVKSLFTTLAGGDDLRGVFREATRVLKGMRLGPLYMALQLVRLRDRHLTAASAGMPYPLLYRARSGTVEEIVLTGAPLGHAPDFPYEQAERTLEPGDTLLLMSDGLAELFNGDREMLDYDRVRRAFRETAAGSPAEIVDGLAALASAWRGERLPNDDITFLVLKAKGAKAVAETGGTREHSGVAVRAEETPG